MERQGTPLRLLRFFSRTPRTLSVKKILALGLLFRANSTDRSVAQAFAAGQHLATEMAESSNKNRELSDLPEGTRARLDLECRPSPARAHREYVAEGIFCQFNSVPDPYS